MGYQTRTKRLLDALFHDHPEMTFSAAEVQQYLIQEGQVPARSTVYRLLHEMTDAGELWKSVHPDSKKTVFRLSQGRVCTHHLHFVCSQCGASVHMDEQISKTISQLLSQRFQTKLDMAHSVLTGECEHCSQDSDKER